MALSPVTSSQATAAYGLDFPSLLRIILTQLTYQDPLKPVDNAEFVSQLAQFSQLQQSQTLNEQVTSLIAAQAATQATGMLGRTVDIAANGATTASGQVTGIAFSGGTPQLTIRTSGGETLTGIAISDVSQVR